MLYFNPFEALGSLIVNVITESVFVMCLCIITFTCSKEECNNDGTVNFSFI